jgi:hypothetical protein
MIRNVRPGLTPLMAFIYGAFSSCGVCVEAPGRRLEIGQYVFPKVLEGNI